MAWKRAGRQTYDTTVRPLTGASRDVSTGMRSLERAELVEAWMADVRERGDRRGVLQAVAEGRVKLRAAYAWGEEETRRWLDAQAAALADTDVLPLLDQWADQMRESVPSTTRYVTQIRVLYPEDPWRKSLLAPSVIFARLEAVKVKSATRNRYRAALSAFCNWLVQKGVLDANPVRAFKGFKESKARTVFYLTTDAQRVVQALPAAFRGREALMAGTGMDWSDTARLAARDVDLKAKTIRCHGSKTTHRNRTIRLTEAWTVPYVRAALAGKTGDTLIFSSTSRDHDQALDAHHAAVKACKLPYSTLHDWRHTYAVNALKRREAPQVVAHQLGHGSVYQVLTRYGKYVPELRDYK